MIKVQVIDDSSFVRTMLSNLISSNAEFEVVGISSNGEEGVNDYKRLQPDIVLLDIEMPVMDGLQCLKEILSYDRAARVIMCSALTKAGADATFEALQIGAFDFLTKPSARTIDDTQNFKEQLFLKLKAHATHSKFQSSPLTTNIGAEKQAQTLDAALKKENNSSDTDFLFGGSSSLLFDHASKSDGAIKLRDFPAILSDPFPQALMIGASTGGPKALIDLLTKVKKECHVPIFITQHIPASFTKSFADSLTNYTNFQAVEAQQDMPIKPGHIYIAPGGMHMGIKRAAQPLIDLIDAPAVNYCKPSVDVMFDSIADYYHDNLIAVILTGLGHDGRDAVQNLVTQSRKNIILVQDKSSSAVWGMPGAVALAGLSHAVLPLDEMAQLINALLRRKLPR
jgi:two-component system chemotaxis response regulator CheB